VFCPNVAFSDRDTMSFVNIISWPESPNGANVVIIHDIKTPVDSDTLRYLAAVKGKALLDESPHSKDRLTP
jgi:hypothetical protein